MHDITADAIVEELEGTDLGREIRKLEESMKRYSRISFVGMRKILRFMLTKREKQIQLTNLLWE
ncbi:MAG: hypothetical protein ACOCQG_05265 [Candidatus Nanoarchaeia archaeon]